MKNFLQKLYQTFFMLSLAVSIIFLGGGFMFTLPQGTYVNGIEISKLTKKGAVKLLERAEEDYLKSQSLRIFAGDNVYTYNYPEFNATQNFEKIVSGITCPGEYFADVYVYLNGEGEVADYICADVFTPVREPEAIFNKDGQPFTYVDGRSGREADKTKLINDIRSSLNGQFEDVHVAIKNINCHGNMLELKGQTQLLYTFTTYFDGDNIQRKNNICLAAKKINGTILQPDQTFSFNAVVGERTVKNGFFMAKIIEDGKYADGIGGGVCQVSTTLYNAAILSGLEIEEYHPHSLKVGYVPPSRDAMVSGNYYDLKFKNNKLTPIYIRTNVNYDSVTCMLYGKADGWKYSFVSELGEGGEDDTGESVVSFGYLLKEKDGIIKKTLIRRDKYGLKAKDSDVATN